jgi:predicted transcriptional regulator
MNYNDYYFILKDCFGTKFCISTMCSLSVWERVVISFIYYLKIDMCMSGFKFDPSQPGLRKILREWEELALRYVWSIGEVGANSGPVWRHVNEQLGPGDSRSRASIILAMNRFVDQGVLGWRDATGKGGHHRVYYPLMNESEHRKYIIRTLVKSVMRDFPEETHETLKEFI